MESTKGTAVVTGATGAIGHRLVAAWGEERTVVIGRKQATLAARFPRARAVAWDGAAGLPSDAVDGADTVFHLAGEPVAEGRWNAEKKERIVQSRVLGTRAVVDAIRAAKVKPKTLVCASAVGFYGSRGDEVLDESSAPGSGFLSEVCAQWEAEADAARALGVRVTKMRIGIVLMKDGGALAKMLPLFRTGLAGPLGDGRQWMPWIHVEDVLGLLRFASEREVEGPVNVAAPNVVTNKDFTRALAKAVHRFAILPAPKAALRLVLGEVADVVLGSQRAVPKKALDVGYTFRFTRIEDAFADLLGPV